MIYQERQGNPLIYAYFTASGAYSVNGDYRSDNDLVYVPASRDEIVLNTGTNWGDLNNFIENNDINPHKHFYNSIAAIPVF